MVKIVITDSGKDEVARYGFDIKAVINQILSNVPIHDLKGISHIYVTDLPVRRTNKYKNSWGAYFQQHNRHPAYVEIYLKNLFDHIKSAESMNLMLPIQSIGLAQTMFHEVGHHIEYRRSHGVKKRRKESFADSYASKLLDRYMLDNADTINCCFDNLEKITCERGLSIETLHRMREGWDKQHQAAINNTRQS